jgi:hypothetical protein
MYSISSLKYFLSFSYKNEILFIKNYTFSSFFGSWIRDPDSQSGSGPTKSLNPETMRIRIRIHNPGLHPDDCNLLDEHLQEDCLVRVDKVSVHHWWKCEAEPR